MSNLPLWEPNSSPIAVSKSDFKWSSKWVRLMRDCELFFSGCSWTHWLNAAAWVSYVKPYSQITSSIIVPLCWKYSLLCLLSFSCLLAKAWHERSIFKPSSCFFLHCEFSLLFSGRTGVILTDGPMCEFLILVYQVQSHTWTLRFCFWVTSLLTLLSPRPSFHLLIGESYFVVVWSFNLT